MLMKSMIQKRTPPNDKKLLSRNGTLNVEVNERSFMVYNSQYSKRKTSTKKNFFGKEINIMLCKFVKPLDQE